jgi:hypothetical protein
VARLTADRRGQRTHREFTEQTRANESSKKEEFGVAR